MRERAPTLWHQGASRLWQMIGDPDANEVLDCIQGWPSLCPALTIRPPAYSPRCLPHPPAPWSPPACLCAGLQVGELEGLFERLRGDVEALFMAAPSVDLQALARQLEGVHGQVDEQVGGCEGGGEGGEGCSDEHRVYVWWKWRGWCGLLPAWPAIRPHVRTHTPAGMLRPPPPPSQASIVAALSSDLSKVQQFVEQAAEQLAADPSASVQASVRAV